MTQKFNSPQRDKLLTALILIIITGLQTQAGTFDTPKDSSAIAIERPVNSAFTFDLGGASILDTYLTPIKYKGMNMRLGYERLQAMKFNPIPWVMQMDAGIEYQRVKNIPRNHSMHSLMVEYQWGMMHRWSILPGLQLMAGGSTRFRGGAIYNSYNSNNPVSPKIHWSVNLTGMAVYNTTIGRLPVTLRYQATLPFIGAFFSPEYGESFYEIYLGNLDNIVHCGWWGNRFDLRNVFTADLHFGRTSLRLGYRGQIETSFVNNLNYQFFTNSFIIGVSGEWMSLKPLKNSIEKARIISVLY